MGVGFDRTPRNTAQSSTSIAPFDTLLRSAVHPVSGGDTPQLLRVLCGAYPNQLCAVLYNCSYENFSSRPRYRLPIVLCVADHPGAPHAIRRRAAVTDPHALRAQLRMKMRAGGSRFSVLFHIGDLGKAPAILGTYARRSRYTRFVATARRRSASIKKASMR